MLSHALRVGSVCNHQQRESHTQTFLISLLLTCACTSTGPQRTRIGRGLLRGFQSRSSGYEQYMTCYRGFCLYFLLMLRFRALSLLPANFSKKLLLAGVEIRQFLKHMHRGVAHFWPVDTFLLTVTEAERKSKEVTIMEWTGSSSDTLHYTRSWKNWLWLVKVALLLLQSEQHAVLPLERVHRSQRGRNGNGVFLEFGNGVPTSFLCSPR